MSQNTADTKNCTVKIGTMIRRRMGIDTQELTVTDIQVEVIHGKPCVFYTVETNGRTRIYLSSDQMLESLNYPGTEIVNDF